MSITSPRQQRRVRLPTKPWAEAEANGRRAELAPLLDRARAGAPIHAYQAADWLDCGNADRQASSHQVLLQQRAFNELTIDPILGTITKRSQQVEKFIDEINFLRLLPSDLSVLFPRIIDYSPTGNRLGEGGVLRLSDAGPKFSSLKM